MQIIYSGGVDVDILPLSASKGKALDFLLQQVNIDESLPVPACLYSFVPSLNHLLVNQHRWSPCEVVVLASAQVCNIAYLPHGSWSLVDSSLTRQYKVVVIESRAVQTTAC